MTLTVVNGIHLSLQLELSKEKDLNSDGQHFHQYQQNERSPRIPTH
jgi:hypothetical protein